MADDPHDDVRNRLSAEPVPRMPDHVAARLHESLAAESAARDASEAASESATVSPLRRRARWKTPLLAAAGVVAVVAIGVPVINQVSDQSDGGAGSSDSVAGDSTEYGAQDQPDSSAPESSSRESGDAAEGDGLRQYVRSPMELDRAGFGSQVAGYLDPSLRESLSSKKAGVADVTCSGSTPSAPGVPRATLDGDPAVVLGRQTPGGDVRVEAVVCGSDGPTVAARATLD